MRRFIIDKPFSEPLNQDDFNIILDHKKSYSIFFYFNENGIVDSCPRCSNCQDGFLKIKPPDLETEKGMIEIERAKSKMKEYLENHIQNEIEKEIGLIRPSIEAKVRREYIKTTPKI